MVVSNAGADFSPVKYSCMGTGEETERFLHSSPLMQWPVRYGNNADIHLLVAKERNRQGLLVAR